MPRYFQSVQLLVLPQSVKAGPGATNLRLVPGSIIELDEETCTRNERFLNGRLRAGCLVEVDAAAASAASPSPEVLPAPDPTKAPMPIGHGLGQPGQATKSKER